MKKNIISINMIMKQYIKYLCAALFLFCTGAHAWGDNATYYVWDATAKAWAEYVVQDENISVVEGPEISGYNFYGWHIWNPDVYPNWKTTNNGYIQTDGGAYYSTGGENSTKYVRFYPNTAGNTNEKNTGKNEADNKLYAIYVPTANPTTGWTKDPGWSAGSTTKITVDFYANVGTGTYYQQTMLKSTSTMLHICEFEAPSGKVFSGWATSPSGSVAYGDQESVSFNSDQKLYAIWGEECEDISSESVIVHTATPVWNCSAKQWEITASCEPISGATSYGFALQKYDNGWKNVQTAEFQTGTTKTYTTGITANTQYRVGVVARNGNCDPVKQTNPTLAEFPIPTCSNVTNLGVAAYESTNSAELLWSAEGGAGCEMLYEVTVKKHSDNSVVWSQSPASTTEGATITGLTSNTTYDVYVTATNACGNSNDNGGASVEQFTTTKGFTDNKWTCIDMRLVQTDGNTADPLLITGGYGLGTSSVEATRTLTLTIGGVAANSVVTLSGTNLRFFKNNGSHTEIGASNLTCDASGNLSEVIKVEYAPTAYTDDNIATPGITVSCDGNIREFAGLVKARCLPEKFVIAAKVNGRWCALPADLATSSGTAIPDAYPISVDNESAPRVATIVPKAAVYGFSARNAVTSHTGGIRLDTKTGSNDGHLQAPRSNTETYLWRASTNAGTGMQDWYLTSTGTSDAAFYNYNIGVDPACTLEDGTTPISKYLCVYGNKIMWSSTSDKVFRILPIEKETEPVEMQIVEWKADKVVFMYFGNPAYKVTAEIEGVSKASEAVLNSVQVDHGVYEIAVSDLLTSAYKQLYIIIKDGGTEIGRKAVTVPLIINNTTTVAAAASGLTKTTQCPKTDVVVLNGAKLTAEDTTPYQFNSVTVYGGGKLIVAGGKGLNAGTMYLRAGALSSGTYQYVYPQVYIGTGATLTVAGNIINFDYLTNYNQYFAIAFPHTAAISNTNITYPEDIYGAYAKTGSYILRVFDGKIRATRGAVDAVWADVEEGNTGAGGSISVQTNTVRGLGYYALFPPRKVSVNGGSATRQEYGIQRVKMNVTDAATLTANETGNTEIPVTAYPAEQVYNSGWWLLGNPYMADLSGNGVTDDGTRKEITVGYLGTNAQGQYEWKDKTVRYVTVPNDEAEDTYDQRLVTDYNFPAFKTFYVQVGTTGSVKFGTSSRSAAAPKRYNAVGMPSEIETSIALNSGVHGDTTYILIGDEFSEEYEIGDDMAKMPNTNVSLYTLTGGYELFANALNKQSAMAGIPVGYTAPAEGIYVFSVNDKKNSTWVGNIWLTDFERNERVNLMEGSYEFETLAGTNKTRFVLNVELRSPNDNPSTGGIETEEETNDLSPQKFILHDKLFIHVNGVIYDATGKKVRQ